MIEAYQAWPSAGRRHRFWLAAAVVAAAVSTYSQTVAAPRPALPAIDAADARARAYLLQLRHRDGIRHRLDHLWDLDTPAVGGAPPALQTGLALEGRYPIVARGGVRQVRQVGDRMVVNGIEDGESILRVFGKDQRLTGTVALPAIGTVELAPAADGRGILLTFSSLAIPPTLYRLDAVGRTLTAVGRPALPFDPDDYVVRRLHVRTKTGTAVPIILAHQRNLDFSKGAATLIFSDPTARTPAFSRMRFPWMDLGGVYAFLPAGQGGDIDADRIVAAAEFLIAQRLTVPAKLGLYGERAGASATQAAAARRPELFSTLVLRDAAPDRTPSAADSHPATLLAMAAEARSIRGLAAATASASLAASGPILVRVGRPGADAAKDEAADIWAFAAHHTRLSDPSPDRVATIARAGSARGIR